MDVEKNANLELDLNNTDWIVNKCCNSDVYSQNLYAALCNNRFFKNDEEWTCSWRYAGGILAEIRNKNEDYLDWYCSGIVSETIKGYVSEGVATQEITNDLLSLGWVIKPYEDEI
jgi:hypothetical protein